MLLKHSYATFNMLVSGATDLLPSGDVYCPALRKSIVCGNCVRETSVKRRNKIVQEITQNVANVYNFYAIISIEDGFSMH